MNLSQLVNRRESLTPAQFESLQHQLCLRLRVEDKQKMKSILRNKFYSTFEDLEFSKQFLVTELGVEFRPLASENRERELKAIKTYLLNMVSV